MKRPLSRKKGAAALLRRRCLRRTAEEDDSYHVLAVRDERIERGGVERAKRPDGTNRRTKELVRELDLHARIRTDLLHERVGRGQSDDEETLACAEATEAPLHDDLHAPRIVHVANGTDRSHDPHCAVAEGIVGVGRRLGTEEHRQASPYGDEEGACR